MHPSSNFILNLMKNRPNWCDGAWTINIGDSAPKAAGKIHTDFERGFIRAETVTFEDYIQNNGEKGSKEAGKLRSEGKEYIVQDGDVIHFLFSV